MKKWKQMAIIAAGCFSAAIEGIAPYAPVRSGKRADGACEPMN